MVVSMDQMKKAVITYMENEILPKVSVDNRLPFGLFILMAPKVMDNLYSEKHQYIEMLEVCTEDGRIDLDRAESVACELMDRYGTFSRKLGKDLRIEICQGDVHRLAEIARVI